MRMAIKCCQSLHCSDAVVAQVLVNGVSVVLDGVFQEGVVPGRGVRGGRGTVTLAGRYTTLHPLASISSVDSHVVNVF